MDGTENDLPLDSPYQIEGFPTLKLYKAQDNEIVDFEGPRDLSGLLAFLKANAVNGADIPDIDTADASDVELDKDDHDEL